MYRDISRYPGKGGSRGGDRMDIRIEDGIIVTMNKGREILKNADIGIDGNRICEIGDVKGEADFVIDARNKIVMPGLINTHTHLPMTLFRGIADDLPLMRWLKEEIWPIESKLTAKHVYAGSLLGCLEMITTGTTCFNEMYFHMDKAARSIDESGMRGVVAYAMFDFGDTGKVDSMIKDGRKKIKKYNKKNKNSSSRENRVSASVGLHSPYTCSKELLKRAKEMADRLKTMVHIHVAETQEEVENTKKDWNLRPFEYLNEIGVLDKNVLAVHSIWADRKEIELIKKNGAKISHNPVSNMKTAAGVANVPEYIRNGITVSLGTDGAASNNNLDMFEEMKACALLHKINAMDAGVVPAEKVLEFATINGAAALGMEKEIGSIEVGKKADIILVDLDRPHLVPLSNPISHLVYSARGSDVDTVLVDGRVLMENRELRSIDQKEVLKFANEQAKDLLEKAGREDRLFLH